MIISLRTLRIVSLLIVGVLMAGFNGPAVLRAQDYTLSGVVRSAESGETLIGVSVVVPQFKRGTYTNAYGYYSLPIPASDEPVEVRFVLAGYGTISKPLTLTEDLRLDLEMSNATLDEVVISAESNQAKVNSTQMSTAEISMVEAKKLPALFGEVDIIKSLQLKPGVSSGSEGSSGIYVRGGGPDQNLVLLDNTVLYNPSHLFGFFSTFNSDAVKNVQLYKGGFPAQYGGRLSSVIDVKMNEGNRKHFNVTGGLGLIASRLTVEGPIVRDKASFMLSGRRTYADLITSQVNVLNEDNENFNPIPDYFFYDFNAKANYEISEKDQLYLSGYFGRDRFSFDDETFDFGFDWGNTNATLRWNHLFSNKLFMNTSLSFTDYDYLIDGGTEAFSFQLGSEITDGALGVDFSWQPNAKHSVRFGAQGIYHRFLVGRADAGSQDSSFSFNSGDTYFAQEYGLYINDDFEVNSRLKINYGLRLSGFYNDSVLYANPEPRVAIKYSLSDNTSVKLSYARMVQYLHLVANSGTTLPTDVWYPSTGKVQPQASDQLVAGVSSALGEQWFISNEVYYKWLYNQIDFKDAANLFVNDDLESEFVFGRGWAYGNEFYIEKTRGDLTGWIGYTLSWTYRQFEGFTPGGEIDPAGIINEGEPFFPRSDKRHDISVVAIYELPKGITSGMASSWPFRKLDGISLSVSWEYRSGNAYTLPEGLQFYAGSGFVNNITGQGETGTLPTLVPDFVQRQNVRLPAYHRMDVGLVLRFKPKWGDSDLTISAYNAYNRRNPYFVFQDPLLGDGGVPIGYTLQQVALFPIIPSITYNFKFGVGK